MKSFFEIVSEARQVVTEVEGSDVEEQLAGGVVVIDVREGDEFAQGTLPNAINIPRGRLEADIASRVEPTENIVVMCFWRALGVGHSDASRHGV